MLQDFEINEHGLVLNDYDLRMLDGAEALRQKLEIHLKVWKGEWFLDGDFGMPYLDGILGKQLTISGAIMLFRKQVESIDEVMMITRLDYDFNRQTRILDISFEVQSKYGLIEINPKDRRTTL